MWQDWYHCWGQHRVPVTGTLHSSPFQAIPADDQNQNLGTN